MKPDEMSSLVLVYRLDWVLFAAAVFGSTAFILSRESVRRLFGKRARQQWYWIAAVVLVGGFGAELHSYWIQHERQPQAETNAITYAFEIALDNHAEIAADTLPYDPRREAIETTGRAWMKLNPDLDGLATYRPLPDGTWQQILHIHRDGTAHALASDCAKDSQLLQRAWTGESVFDSGSLLAKGCRRVRSLQPVRDAAGRVEAVLEVEFSTARWTAAILRGRTFTFVRLYILAAMVSPWISTGTFRAA